MNQDDLSKQLHNFSISSGEEGITEALQKTHIASTSTVPSIFSVPVQAPQPPPPPQPQPHHYYQGNVQNKTNYDGNTTSDWDPSSAASNWNTTSSSSKAEDGGWGDGPPSYTSISQGTYFGFNSIMAAPNAMLLAQPSQTQTDTTTNTTAFGRFRHTPVTFVSAAAEAANNNADE
ncbi:hypothetical protein MBANPS3_007650 [Mucor bainieri]